MKIEGLLFPIYSLPGNYGIGEFSKEAFLLLDFLKDHNINEIEILSLNIKGYAHLLNQVYISLDELYSRELISKPFPYNSMKKIVEYKDVSRLKNTYYFEAYSNYVAKFGINPIIDFGKTYKEILAECKEIAKATLNDNAENKRLELFTNYNLFMQMILEQEWSYLKNHAEDIGLKIKVVDANDSSKYTTVLDLLKLNKKFNIAELDENSKCFRLRNFNKLFKIIGKVNND